MRTLVLGAGATGGYLGATLLAAGRDVTFLVRPHTADRLRSEGLRIRGADAITRAVLVPVLTAAELETPFDLVIVAVRGSALATAIDDVRPAVGPRTQVVPLLNGMTHLDALTAAFGPAAVLGATARLAATLLPDGTVIEQTSGIALELGRPGTARPDAALEAVRAELAVDGVSVSEPADILGAMWGKWVFIVASTTLTALTGGVVGEIAAVRGGPELAAAIVDEIAATAAVEGHALGSGRDALVRTLTDPSSRFAPSFTRELWAGRPVEIEVLEDLAARARRHGLPSPRLDAAIVRLRVGGRGGC